MASIDDRRWTTRNGEKVRTNYKGDKPWRARWREYPGAPQKTKHFSKKSDAEVFLTELRHDLLTGAYVDPGATRITLRQYSETWFARRFWRPATRERIERELRLHILPALGNRALGSFKTHHVEEWAASLELAPSSVATVHATLVTIFNAAIKDRRVAQNPAKGAELPEVVEVKFIPLDVAQAKAFVLGLPEHVRASGVLGAGSGMRQGEIFGLTLDRVDFLRRRVRIDRQLVTPTGGRPYLAPVKTRNSNRTITLNEVVVKALSAHLAAYPAMPGLVDDDEQGLLFRSGTLPVTRSMANNYAIRAAKRTALPSTRWHDLRHHHASLLLASGIGAPAVADRLGDTVEVLMATYAHVMPSDDDRIREVVDDNLGESVEDWLRTDEVIDDAAEG